MISSDGMVSKYMIDTEVLIGDIVVLKTLEKAPGVLETEAETKERTDSKLR